MSAHMYEFHDIYVYNVCRKETARYNPRHKLMARIFLTDFEVNSYRSNLLEVKIRTNQQQLWAQLPFSSVTLGKTAIYQSDSSKLALEAQMGPKFQQRLPQVSRRVCS